MQSWPPTHVPLLPGRAPVTRLFDEAIRELRTAGGPGRAGLLVWTSAPVGGALLGDAATAVAADVLVRTWRDAGIQVGHVQVVDDLAPDLREWATRLGRAPADAAHEAAADHIAEMTALGVLPPDRLVAASEVAAEVAGAVEMLLERAAAYRVALPDGPGGVERADLYANLRVDPVLAERQRIARDPVLWRTDRGDGPVLDGGGLGDGLPGASITCAVAGLTYLGPQWDVLVGGRHQAALLAMCESHARMLTGLDHPVQRHLQVGRPHAAGDLAGDSRVQGARLADLLGTGVSPQAVRLLLLSHHYRDDWEYTPVDVLEAESRLDVWTAAVSGNGGPPPEGLLAQVRTALADDLDTPTALAAVDGWAERSLSYGRPDGLGDEDVVDGAPGVAARAVDALLGVRL